ncbi:ABC transporter substrate-binding protein [Alicyclobacillus fastidiosus]|uniref:Extracellular solute-binding protein n=1 Tax=Alicyclobacillus fastidiosus TaxID=392011 RepID=A0ABV5AI24_9BACL|nr:extracellular solute-binding protein [Alicyclobacillus fastidiosus]WEH10112.1 extracellular solute-binding protein [Alicyclobacillus fastidiosus]
MTRAYRNLWSAAAIGLVATMSLTGCGTASNGSSNSNSSQKSVNITFSWWTNPTRTKETQQAISLFEKKYPNIHVTMEYMPWDGYWSKMATEAAAGSAPDVMQMDGSVLDEYVTKNQLMDLGTTSVDSSGLAKDVVQLGDVNGKLYAIPAAVNALAMVYNPALLKQAGVSFDPSKNYTWDDFAKLCEEIHQKLPNVYGATDEIYNEAELAYWARCNGEQMYATDGKSLAISKKTLTNWFTYWLNLQKDGGVPTAQLNAAYNHDDGQTNPFDKSQVAFTSMFIGEDVEYQQYLGKPIVRTMLPDWGDSNKPYSVHPAMYWSMSSTTKYPKQAAELINFLENDPQVSKIFLNERGVTANTSNMEADSKLGNSTVATQDTFMKQVEQVSSPTPLDPPAGSNVTTILQTIGQEVTYGKLTPSQAADQFTTQANQVLSQNS